ncbi:hypothetical protein EDD86DRAFT_244543 [Gorgonomyces haynaldii]|nr:hypothetical protein EDD86DRAFT_244543 [Gorgonomyces haynaldii]
MLLLNLVAAQAVIKLGDLCKTGVDIYACDGTKFLVCQNDVWVLQNDCTTSCIENPGFASNCNRNSVASRAANSATPTITNQSTKSPEQSPTSVPTGQSETPSDKKDDSTRNILLGVLIPIGVIALAVGGFFVYKRQKKEAPETSVGQILDKRYVVIVDYHPVASDELELRQGDVVVLDLFIKPFE